ncbi:hypothetical protein J32TS2_26210 [Shouchella clausii]|nr:hypothetical protein J32TS2_26210 [Shouchella clausii]
MIPPEEFPTISLVQSSGCVTNYVNERDKRTYVCYDGGALDATNT